MRLTRTGRFFALVALLVMLGLLAGFDAVRRLSDAETRFTADRALARWFGFTDPCLATDARYTRHPSLADRHSPFQDYPLALEHFPSGSLVAPPSHLVSAERADATPNPEGGQP